MIYGNKKTFDEPALHRAELRTTARVVLVVAAALALGAMALKAGQALADIAASPMTVAEQGAAEKIAAADAETEAERIEALKAYEQADFDFMRGVVLEPVEK